MRITQSALTRMGVEQLNAQRVRLARTQEQASTGRRINRPSDDPVDYESVLALKNESSRTSRFLRNIDLSRIRLRTTEDALAGAAEALTRARVEGLAAQNTPRQGDSAREASKAVVEQLFDELLSFANTRSPGGGFVFSGFASDTPAFTATGSFDTGVAPTAAFTGDTNLVEVEIDEGVYAEITRSGAAAFEGAGSAFDALGRLWTGIDNADSDAIGVALGEIDAAFEQLQLERVELGTSEAKMNVFEDRLGLQEITVLERLSNLEDADVFEVYSSLTNQQTALQATLQVNSRLLQPTLLDFL